MVMDIANLRLRFDGEEENLFHGLDIRVEEGEKVLLLGPSGSGKSTLLNIMGGLIPRVIDVPMKADRLHVSDDGAYVFQDPDSQFTMPTVGEELGFVLENKGVPQSEMEQEFTTVLEAVGLDVSFGKDIQELSGGMKQKLAIASALLQDSDTLFLDEPASMLDEGSARHVWDTVESIWENRTVVIIEHRVEYIWDRMDRVILMDDSGGIVCQGTPGDMLTNHGDLLTAFGVWHPRSWDGAPALRRAEPSEETLLEANSLDVRRGKDTIIKVDGMKIKRGEWVTIEGANGTGKTSLLLALMKLIPSAGDLHYRGKKIRKTRHIAGAVYPVFQNPELQFITNKVFDEVFINLEMHFDKTEAIRQTGKLLERFGLSGVSHLHPLEISTGQKRRLSVATAAGGVPEIIMFDEPTFGLDQRQTFRLLELFSEMTRAGKSIVMITHDEEIKRRYPSRRLLIEDGRLTERTGVNDAAVNQEI
ncbi:ABC transporter ATP-binding protein [Salinicoccus carnicancri]|uniref:ABC transporter ATP-binding protein n=1 Tax=Salinicoccus carnicancri TaxID=558170 RepID=UPI0002FD0BF3|nr:ABC transporter ATP-binding protein [Salinicoccus carnicancri]